MQAWNDLLPGHPEIGEDLLARWSHPSRQYHDVIHLTECLAALSQLGAPRRTEYVALWFHDAIHTNSVGSDELRSAELAESSLRSVLPSTEVAEISRLIRLTVDHQPQPDDDSGARVCDADLAVLAAPPQRYTESVAQLRAESPRLSTAEWNAARLDRLEQLMARDPLFHTRFAQRRWTRLAMSNLRNEFLQRKSSGY